MASIFTKIINREIPGHIVAEDEKHIAFLDINPVTIGHVLVVPKREVDRYFDLTAQEISQINVFAKKVADGLEKVVRCDRIGVAIVGLEVAHAHIHLLPLNSMQDINFNKPKLSPSPDELREVSEKIKAKIVL